MATEPLDKKTVLNVDPWLENHADHIVFRHSLFRKWKDTIDNAEGGYDKFTKGYRKFGFNIAEDGTMTYREWAPNAKEAVLIGEFSKFTLPVVLSTVLIDSLSDKWNRISHPMTKDRYGVWEITIPPQDGKCAIPHDSKIKVVHASLHVSLESVMSKWYGQ